MNYSLGYNFFRNNREFSSNENGTNEVNFLRTDILEKEGVYYLNIEIPGVKKENLEVGYENNYLTIYVKQNEEHEEVGDYIRRERYTSEMQRTFYVGDIEEENIKAQYQNGILTIKLKKQEEKRPTKKQIIIE